MEADKLRANSTLTLEDREIGLSAIRAETERTIQESMGDSAFRTYREWHEQQALGR